MQEENRQDTIVGASMWSVLGRFSLPMLFSTAVLSAAGFCDIWVSGRLGADAQAAVGMAGQVWFLVLFLSNAMTVGLTAVVSRLWGASEKEEAATFAHSALLALLVMSLLSVGAGIVLSPFILQWQGGTEVTVRLGAQLLSIYLLAQIPGYFHWGINAIYRACGDARLPFLLSLLTCLLVVSLELFFCIYPFHFGLPGIGLAWLVAEIVTAVCAYLCFLRSPIAAVTKGKLMTKTGSWTRIVCSNSKRALKIGVPAALQDCSWFVYSFLLLNILNRLAHGSSCVAAWAVATRVEETVIMLFPYALIFSARSLIGLNLGAGLPKQARLSGWQTAAIAALLSSLVALLLFVFAQPVAAFMSSDAEVAENAALFFRIVALSEPFVALWYVLYGAMQGAGYTAVPMWTTFAGLALLRVGLCFVLSQVWHFALAGVWIGIALSGIISGLFACWQYKYLPWAKRAV